MIDLLLIIAAILFIMIPTTFSGLSSLGILCVSFGVMIFCLLICLYLSEFEDEKKRRL